MVGFQPNATYFKPAGIRRIDLEESVLTVDEFETVRLKDLLGLYQEQAAARMNISQPTFHRMIQSARKRIADAIVNSKAIRIEGGAYKMSFKRFMCYECRHEWQTEYGTGKPDKCPKCSSLNIHRHPEDRGPQRGMGARLGRS